ncbi:MAG: DUF2284 domain-containing protein [Desulfoprunum sp.]
MVNIKIINHKTPTRILEIEKLTNQIPITNITTNKGKFYTLCESGCVNFGYKYSCPPYSPSFKTFSSKYTTLTVICYRIALEQYSESTPYNRVRASNSVLKSLLDKELLNYKSNGLLVVGSGSCRACKPCAAKERLKCKKPDKLIFSLESLGVDVNQLVIDCFGFQLEWYKRGLPQQFTSVIGGVFN